MTNNNRSIYLYIALAFIFLGFVVTPLVIPSVLLAIYILCMYYKAPENRINSNHFIEPDDTRMNKPNECKKGIFEALSNELDSACAGIEKIGEYIDIAAQKQKINNAVNMALFYDDKIYRASMKSAISELEHERKMAADKQYKLQYEKRSVLLNDIKKKVNNETSRTSTQASKIENRVGNQNFAQHPEPEILALYQDRFEFLKSEKLALQLEIRNSLQRNPDLQRHFDIQLLRMHKLLSASDSSYNDVPRTLNDASWFIRNFDLNGEPSKELRYQNEKSSRRILGDVANKLGHSIILAERH